MKRFIKGTRDHLGELDKLAGETEAAERRILQRAQARLDEVNAMITRQRAGIEGAPEAAQSRYLSLIEERGQLRLVIAKATKNLAS